MSTAFKRHSFPFSRLSAAILKAGRMSVSGKNILDENGQVFVPRGYNQGHGELTLPMDPVEDKAMGANTVRIIWRVWGDYGGNNGTIIDGQEAGSPGNFKPTYLQGIVDRVVQAKLAGLKVQLAGDSNCGQNGKQDAAMEAYCTVNGVPGCNFWMPEGQAQRALFLQSWRWLTRRLQGLVDFYEPLVEPSATESSVVATWKLQDEIRTIILSEDPAALFVMGPWPAYQIPSISDAMNPAWVGTGNIILTANLLDSAVTNSATLPAKITQAVTARATYGVPVMINQIGSNTSTDPDDSLLGSALTQLSEAANGSIGFTIWEKIAINSGSYGTWTQSGIGQPRTVKENRRAMIEARFRAPVVAAT